MLYARFEGQASLEEAVRRLVPYLSELGLELAAEKSEFCIFSRISVDHLIEGIEIGDSRIPCSPTLRYLGVVLDANLSWQSHIEMISGIAVAAVNVMRVLAHLEWAALLFDEAREHLLKRLDTVQYSELRLALGCMRITPIPKLLSEANEVPLAVRRSLLLNRNAIRMGS